MVCNKVDVCHGNARVERDMFGRPCRIWVSAQTGAGTGLLIQAISELLAEDMVETQITLQPHEGSIRAKLFALGAVVREDTDMEGQIHMDVRIEQRELLRLQSK